MFLASCSAASDDTKVDMIDDSSKSASVVKKCNIETAEKGNKFLLFLWLVAWLTAGTASATVLRPAVQWT